VSRVNPTPQAPPNFSEKDLHGWQIVRRFQAALVPVLAQREPGASEHDPRRTLAAQAYFSLLLFTLFNPVITTLRGLVKASALTRVQQEVSSAQISLASFSEAQHLFDPELLRGVLGACCRKPRPTVATRGCARWVRNWWLWTARCLRRCRA